jgi:hypothetical protein
VPASQMYPLPAHWLQRSRICPCPRHRGQAELGPKFAELAKGSRIWPAQYEHNSGENPRPWHFLHRSSPLREIILEQPFVVAKHHQIGDGKCKPKWKPLGVQGDRGIVFD